MLACVFLAAALAVDATDGLERLFDNPPQSCGVNVWWHWQGPNVTKAGITRDLEAMKSAGVSGATIFTIQEVGWDCESRLKTPVNPALSFGNEVWWDMVRYAVEESRRLGLDLGIHNCAGYSCSGGDWIKPENAMKKLVWAKGDAQPETRLGFYRDIAKVETTNGVYRFGYTCTGKCCHPPPPGQEESCLEADKMSRRAVALHLDNVLGGFAAHGITASSPGLRFVLMDSYEAGWDGNWTDDMVEEFKRRRGYDPVPFLPVLAGMSTKFGEGPDVGFREDFWLTRGELQYERHYRQFKERLNAAGFEFHLEPYTGPFDGYEAARWCDLGMNEFWEGTPFWGKSPYPGGSDWIVGPVSRAFGREIIGAEAFTGYPLDDPFALAPRHLKAGLDSSYCRGLNRLSLHHWCHQPLDARWKPGFSMGPWGTHFGENATWFEPGKAFYRYMQRVQALLQQGRLRTDALGVHTEIDGHFTMDLLPYSAFCDGVEVTADGKVRVKATGKTYPILVTDPAWLKWGPKHLLEKQVRAKVDELEKSGVPVCRDGNPDATLAKIGVKPAFEILEGAGKREVLGLARQVGGTSFFFVANLTKSPRRIKAAFRPPEGNRWRAASQLWFPETGRKCRGPGAEDAGCWLTLNAEESVFVVFADRAGELPRPEREFGEPVAVGGWTVEFPDGKKAEGLSDWSKSPDDDIRYFSGTATYRTRVKGKGRARLSLGAVRDIAEIFVNGVSQGVAWHDPFEIDVVLPEEDNVLEVKVTNAWTNRLIGDEREPDDCEISKRMECFWPKTKGLPETIAIGKPVVAYPTCVLSNTVRTVARKAFSTWRYNLSEADLRPSGLIGPVTISPQFGRISAKGTEQ